MLQQELSSNGVGKGFATFYTAIMHFLFPSSARELLLIQA